MPSPSTAKPSPASGPGTTGPYSMGGQSGNSPGMMYGGVSSNQRSAAMAPPGTGGGGAGMDNPSVMPMSSGSMYGAGNNSGYGNMYGQNGSMYNQGSMYGMGGAMPAAGATGGGSMYGVGSMYMPGSMYGLGGGLPPNTGHYSGSLYGGSLFGISGNLYSEGGSLYGSGSGRDIMGSMQGFGSMYEVRAHTDLGSVRKIEIPWYSIVYGSMGTAGSELNLSANPSFRGSIYDRHSSAGNIGSFANMDTNASSRRGGSTLSAASGGSMVESPSNRGASGADKSGKSAASEPAKSRDAKFTSKSDDTKKADAKKDAEEKPVAMGRRSLAKVDVDEIAEAPKSPHSTRTISGRGLVVATDHKIQVVGVIEKSTKAMVRVKAGGADESTLTVDGKSFPLSECVQCDPAAKGGVESQRVAEVVDHLVAGHNTALFIADDGKATKAPRAFAESAVNQLLTKFKGNQGRGDTSFYLHFSACATRKAEASKDLLTKGASYVLMDIGASPLFGTIVMKLKSTAIQSPSDFSAAMDELYSNLTDADKLIFGWLVLRVVKPNAAQKTPDVFLSAMQLVVSRDGAAPFMDAMQKKEESVPIDLFRYSLGGPGVTVAAVCVLDSNSGSTALVDDMSKLGSVKNASPRSGNVRRFIEYTEDQHKRLQARLEEAPSSERADVSANCVRLQEILNDAKKVVANPGTAPLGVYRSMRRADVSPSKQDAKGDARSPGAGAAAKTRGLDNLITPGGGARAGSPSQAAQDGNAIRTIAVANAKEGRNFVIQDKQVIASAVSYTMDDVVMQKDIKPINFNSSVMTSAISTFVKGSNAAIVSADGASMAKNVFDAPAWSAVAQAVNDCVSRTGAKTNALRVSIALIRATGEAMDLVKGGPWKPLVVAASPLFGPLVHTAQLHQVTTLDAFQALVAKSRANLGSNWGTDTAVYCSLVSCFSTSSDVYVASMLASFCGTNVAILNDAMQRRGPLTDPYRYAFGGTAHTVCVVSLGDSDSTNDVASALNSQRTAKCINNRPVRRGSVTDFVKYTETTLEKRKRRVAESTNAKEREANERLVLPVQSMLADHQALLKDPVNNFPRAYAPDQSNGSTKENGDGGNKGANGNANPNANNILNDDAAESQAPAAGFVESQVVAFVNRPASATARFVTVGKKEYAVDEVVQRITDSSGTITKPSIRMAELEKWFTAVHNCAIVSTSTVTQSLKEEPAWMYLRQILLSTMAKAKREEEVQMELSFTVISASELLGDLLASGVSPSKKSVGLDVGSSPLCGPTVYEATKLKAANGAEVEKIMDMGLENATRFKSQLYQNGAMLVCTVLQRRRSDKDVLVSSMTTCHLQGPSVDAYKSIPEALDQRAMIFNCIFGGPCSTVAILNYDKEEDPRNRDMTEVVIGLAKRSRNLGSRPGSVSGFVRYSQDQQARTLERAKQMRPDNAERAEVYQQKAERLGSMIKDHQRILDNYSAPIPTYLSVNPNASTSAAPAASSPSGGKTSNNNNNNNNGPNMRSAELSPGTVAKSQQKAANEASPKAQTRSPGAKAASTPATANLKSPDAAAQSPSNTRSPGSNGKPPASPQAASQPRAAASPAKTPSPQTQPRTAADSPSTYPPHRGANVVKTVAVVTGTRVSPGAFTVTVTAEDDTHIQATMAGGTKSFLFDEVVSRPDRAATVRSDTVNELIGTALAGSNVSLLCTEQGNGSTSVSMASRVVRAIFSKLRPGSEVWMSLTTHKDGSWKDAQNIGSSFRELEVSSSPLFGPCPYGSWMLQVRDAQSFETALTAAAAEAMPAQAMCMACVVLKQVLEKDVCLSSILLTIANDSSAEYQRIASIQDKHKRGMFQYALGAVCFTVCAFNCNEKVNEEGLDRALNFHESIRGLSGSPMRNGSVKNFCGYMTSQCKKAAAQVKNETDPERRRRGQAQLAKFSGMVEDAESMLSSPAGLVPPMYRL